LCELFSRCSSLRFARATKENRIFSDIKAVVCGDIGISQSSKNIPPKERWKK